MPGEEIEVPKELREFMLEGAEETVLGQKNGAYKQYRYGNLHIREYDDKFLVHTDRIDPREDPLGHLVRDAPEILIGLACGFLLVKRHKSFNNSKKLLIVQHLGLISSLLFGYIGYAATKKIKQLFGVIFMSTIRTIEC